MRNNLIRWIIDLTPLSAQQFLLKSQMGSKDIHLIHPIIRKQFTRYTTICLNIVVAAIPSVPRGSINKDHQQLTCVLAAITVKVMFHRILFRQRDPRPPLKWTIRPRDRLQVILCQVIIKGSILRLPTNTWVLQQMYLAIKARKIGGQLNETEQMLSQWPSYEYMMPISSISTLNLFPHLFL